MVARSASTTQKDTTTGDGKRETNFTKSCCYGYRYTFPPLSRGSNLNLEQNSVFCDMMITVAHVLRIKVHKNIGDWRHIPPLEIRLLLRPF